MALLRPVLVTALLLAGVCRPALVSAGDETKANREALRVVQKQLRSPTPAQRVEAVERLRDLPALESVRLIVPSMLNDPAAEVRRAAYQTLLTWKDDGEVCGLLLKILDKGGRGKKPGIVPPAPLIGVLLASDSPDAERELGKFLDGYAAASQDGVVTLITVADDLGKQADRQALTSLRRMTTLKCFSSMFACRRAVIQAMTLVRLPGAVETLIGLLPKLDGEVRADVVRYLTAVSGQQYGVSGPAWLAWWKEHKDDFAFPTKADQQPANGAAVPGMPSYYGLTIQARRMVFVLDVSSSMNGPRLLAAKRELTTAIEGLPNDAAFNIIAFSSQVVAWQQRLVPATPATKQAARQFLYGLQANGRTAAYDALEAAFRLDVEAIYFLSDGEPTAGKIVAPAAILAAVGQTNRGRRISLYTIGIAPGLPGSPLDAFVRLLAEQNFGAYRRVDQ